MTDDAKRRSNQPTLGALRLGFPELRGGVGMQDTRFFALGNVAGFPGNRPEVAPGPRNTEQDVRAFYEQGEVAGSNPARPKGGNSQEVGENRCNVE